MNLGESLKAALVANGTINGLVDGRVWPVVIELEDDAKSVSLPAISYMISNRWEHDLNSSFRRADVSIRAHAESYDESHTLAAAVVALLNRFAGTLGGVGGVVCRHIIALEDTEGYQDITPEVGAFFVTTAFDVLYV